MDVRELYGASPWQGRQQDLLAEEAVRIGHATQTSGMMFALPATVTEDTKDGHTVSVQPSIKRAVVDPKTGEKTYEDHPVAVDVPIHHPGSGGYTSTFPVLKGHEGIIVYASRHIDAWHQSGGSQQPMDDALNDLGDAFFIPGVRSTPRKLSNVSLTSAQMRTDDGQHVVDLHQQNGVTLSVAGGDHTVTVHPTAGIAHKSSVAVSIEAPTQTFKGALSIAPTDDGQGGSLTIQQVNGVGGTLNVAQAITALSVTAPNGKVGT